MAEGDIRCLDECRDACEGVDYVLHQAALGSVLQSIADPLATNAANVKPVAPVDFKELLSILPEIPGWERNHPEAERMTSPVSFSYASTKYKKDDVEVTEKITDSGFNQLLIAPISAAFRFHGA